MAASRVQRRALLTAAAGAAATALTGWPARSSARARAFPERAVRLVVPYSVGVGPDVVARSVAERLALQWDQPVLVDNKPGASGIVAFADVRRAAPDGHTLFLADTSTLAVNPLLHATLPYDPVRDFVPLTLLFRATFLLWVGGASRWRSLADLLDAARRAPERISYATFGNGHPSHLAIETLARAEGLQMLHVPFKDAGALLTAVASGEVDFTALAMNTVAGLMASGRMRPLAVAATARLASHADIPTLVEAGGPALTMHPWAALMAVAGTPPAVLDRLQQDIGRALATPQVRGRAELAGFEITPSTPHAVVERVAADQALYAPLLVEGRIRQV